MNEKWECFLCSKEEDFEILPDGYLSNSHPLCCNCANSILQNENHKHRFRLTYHKKLGDIILVSNVPILTGNFTKN